MQDFTWLAVLSHDLSLFNANIKIISKT